MKYHKLTKKILLVVFFCYFWIVGNISYAGHLSSDINGINESRYKICKENMEIINLRFITQILTGRKQ